MTKDGGWCQLRDPPGNDIEEEDLDPGQWWWDTGDRSEEAGGLNKHGESEDRAEDRGSQFECRL